MNATQQHMFDTYRAARLSEPAPPLPGTQDRRTLRDLYRYRLTRRPARGSGSRGVPSRPTRGLPDIARTPPPPPVPPRPTTPAPPRPPSPR
ncbi:hypothetical protein [Streptomyces sp. NPDC049916]|uniref:hypothetical protein n=1 Tax=Streptomyces sp. NPDC049916 TaxID=3155156 RepID=UPI0034263DE1